MNKPIAHPAELEVAAKTHTGLRRENNEDAVVVNPDYGLAILADGMGGYNAGEVASSIATSVIQVIMEEALRNFNWSGDADPGNYFRELMRGAICRANRQIIQAASIGQQFKGMGTTVVMGLFYRDRVIAAHVGDSRLYRFRQGELRLLTRDHSLFQEQLDAGLIKAGSKRLSSNQNFLTRAVGVGREIEIDARSHSTQEGDLFLFCSDGISDMLSNQQIGAILCEHGAIPDLACDALIANANAQGGMDNSSVILVKIESGPQEKKGFLGRVFTRLMRVPSSSFFRLT